MKIKTVLGTLITAGLLAAALVALVVFRGSYDVAATVSHTQTAYYLFERALGYSVKRRAKEIDVPPLSGAAMLDRGAACYRDSCVQCHGAPGVAPDGIGLGLQPLPGPLVDAARTWRPAELYWITRNGIKMTGMPAWEFRLSENDMWSVVALLQRLPDMTPASYGELMERVAGKTCEIPANCQGSNCPAAFRGQQSATYDSWEDRARLALNQYGCAGCHTISGVVGAHTRVGPPLEDFAKQAYIAGELPNTVENLAAWIRHPQSIDKATAMPDLNVTEEHAQLMARYLNKR